MKLFLKNCVAILAASLLATGAAWAGSLTPSASPAASGYTLTDIYNRLDTNAVAGTHSFTPAASPAGSLYTLAQIYGKIPTINAAKLLSDTTYLGVTGSILTRALDNSTTTVAAGYYAAADLATADTDLAAGNIKSGVTIFGVPGSFAGATSKLPDTGQAASYSATFGEDHDYTSANSAVCDRAASGIDASFTDNGDGTITDHCTNLTWQKCSYGLDATACTGSPGTRTWEQALTYCEGLSLGGGGTWRLPNINELLSIVNYSRIIPSINVAYFPSTPSGTSQWSSSTYGNDASLAWYVRFDDGYTYYTDKTANFYVRCVRGQ